jgi:lipid II:glycine glycyltransferase (peptidoglycan interpeptide bridge formation enzyme)
MLFDFIKAYGTDHGWKYLEFRGEQPFFAKEIPSAYYFGHILDLVEDSEKLFCSLRESTRRNIKKARKEGVEVTLSTSLDSIKEFYNLNCLTRKCHGLPPQPYSFFKNVHQYVMSKSLGFVILASYKGKYVAGAVFFHFGEKPLYKYGASDRRYQHLRANNLVMWEAIKWYSKNGYKDFCFGRTEPGNKGLLQFKAGWNTKEKVINYYKYDLNKNLFAKDGSLLTGFHNKVFNYIPIPLSKIIGSILYKHLA